MKRRITASCSERVNLKMASENPELFDPKSSILSDVFPCGYVDREGNLHKDFIVSELTGEEEDILAGDGPIIPRMNKMIHNLLQSVGSITDREKLADVVRRMTAVDRLVAFIAIRRATHKDIYRMLVNMPEDSAEPTKRFTVNLANLERTSMKDPEKRKRSDELSTGHVMHWHIMDGMDEMWLDKVRDRTKGEHNVTLQILSRIDGIDDQKINRGKIDDDTRMLSEALKKNLKLVKKIPTRIRNEMRRKFDEVEGTIDLSLDFDYETKSGKMSSFTSVLDVRQREFFFPAETSDS